jgi:ankyrin repeat protein
LHGAASGGHETVVRLLLEKGVDITAKDKDEWTALHWAAENGHEAVALLLAEQGGVNLELKEKKWGHTPLVRAARGGHRATVRVLLNKGANPNVQDHRGHTPMYRATKFGHSEVVKMLLEKGANPNIQNNKGRTPMWKAKSLEQHAVETVIKETAMLRPN